jgi:hypothetical protein
MAFLAVAPDRRLGAAGNHADDPCGRVQITELCAISTRTTEGGGSVLEVEPTVYTHDE